ncbi:hypothetical protein [Listeria immobilis]|uniref:hypothetical protein n=1 Tax=Listeria immobilis TaxID=2713502 RepID=UPI00162352ED|nr:hypothetical protein [Listeria immobilis]
MWIVENVLVVHFLAIPFFIILTIQQYLFFVKRIFEMKISKSQKISTNLPIYQSTSRLVDWQIGRLVFKVIITIVVEPKIIKS